MDDKKIKKPLLRRIYDEIYEFAEAIVLICYNIIRGIWRDSKNNGRLRGRLIILLITFALYIFFSIFFKSAGTMQ
jgi:hypothetical protein